MKYAFLLLGIFISCDKNDVHSFTVTKCLKVEADYQYSRERKIRVNSYYYYPKLTLKYVDCTISELVLYKSEGSVVYDGKDLAADTLLMKELKISPSKKIRITGNDLTDNKTERRITKINSDSIFCVQADTLFLFVLN